MALKLGWPDPNGVTPILGAYVRWVGLSIDTPIKTIQAWFHVFRDQAAADAGKPPIDQVHLVADQGTDPSYDQLTADQAAEARSLGELVYGFAKARPEFVGAEDV